MKCPHCSSLILDPAKVAVRKIKISREICKLNLKIPEDFEKFKQLAMELKELLKYEI